MKPPSKSRADAFHGLHVLADDDPRWPIGPVAQAQLACAGGAQVVQLRAKHTPDREALAWAREIRAITRASAVQFVINDRFDLALASNADAVHLGQTDLPPSALPEEARKQLAVGRSTHSPQQARQARSEAIDYVAYGPVFGTTSKTTEFSARGLGGLADVVTIATPLPVVAIGGIDAVNIADVVRAGALGAAVISAVVAAADPTAAVRELVQRMRE